MNGVIPDDQPLPEGYRYITNGELKTFKTCKREWYLNNYLNLGLKKPKIAGPAPLGTRVHSVLAHYYDPNIDEDPFDTLDREAARDLELAEDRPESEIKALRADIDQAKIVVEGYLEWLEETGADVGLEVVAPEARMTADPKIPDLPHVRLLAKVDLRVLNKLDNSRRFLDHKIVKSFEYATKTLKLDEQMLHYELINRLDLQDRDDDPSLRTDGAIYNMMRVVKRTGTAKPPFYFREVIRHNKEQIRSYYTRLVQTIREIESLRSFLDQGLDHKQVAYPSPTRDCSWRCDYFSICGMFDDGSDIDRLLNDRYVQVNPLKRYEIEQLGKVS